MPTIPFNSYSRSTMIFPFWSLHLFASRSAADLLLHLLFCVAQLRGKVKAVVFQAKGKKRPSVRLCAVNLTIARVKLTRVRVNRTWVKVNLTRVKVNQTKVGVNLTWVKDIITLVGSCMIVSSWAGPDTEVHQGASRVLLEHDQKWGWVGQPVVMCVRNQEQFDFDLTGLAFSKLNWLSLNWFGSFQTWFEPIPKPINAKPIML